MHLQWLATAMTHIVSVTGPACGPRWTDYDFDVEINRGRTFQMCFNFISNSTYWFFCSCQFRIIILKVNLCITSKKKTSGMLTVYNRPNCAAFELVSKSQSQSHSLHASPSTTPLSMCALCLICAVPVPYYSLITWVQFLATLPICEYK